MKLNYNEMRGYLLILTALVLGGVQFFSYMVHPDSFIGSLSYETLKVFTNQFLYGEIGNTFGTVWSFLSLLPTWIARVVMVGVGIGSFATFLSLMARLKIDKKVMFYSSLLLIINPLFLYFFSSINTVGIAVFFILLSVRSLLKDSWLFYVFFSLGLLSNVVVTVFSIPVILFLARRKKTMALFTFLSTLIYALTTLVPLSSIFALQPGFVETLFVYFNAEAGYSLAFLALSTYGLGVAWKRRWKNVLTYSYVLVLFVLSLYFVEARILVTFLLSIFGGIALSTMVERDWELDNVKAVTFLLIFFSIFFSTLVFFDNEVNRFDEDVIEASEFLGSGGEGVVLSVERNGPLISYLSGKEVFLDTSSYRNQGYERKKDVQNTVFNSRDVSEIDELFTNESIRYVFIDERMKEGEVWDSDSEGFLFLTDFSDRLDLVFKNEDVEIYRYST